MILYLAAVVLWMAAVLTLVVSTAGFLESTTLLTASAVLSGLAIVAAVSGLVVSRRR